MLSCLALLFSQSAISEQSNQSNTPQQSEKTKKLYRVVDKNGNVSYSDTPSPGAKEIVMDEVPSISFKTPKFEFKNLEEQSKTDTSLDTSYYTNISFLDLPQDGVIRNNAGIAPLTASLEPTLANGHFLKFYIDGKLIGRQQKEITITAENIEYGPHTASFIVVAANGVKIQRSDTVKFNLLHVVRKKTSNNNAANNILNNQFFETNLPQHPKVPSYDSMKQTDQTDK